MVLTSLKVDVPKTRAKKGYALSAYYLVKKGIFYTGFIVYLMSEDHEMKPDVSLHFQKETSPSLAHYWMLISCSSFIPHSLVILHLMLSIIAKSCL